MKNTCVAQVFFVMTQSGWRCADTYFAATRWKYMGSFGDHLSQVCLQGMLAPYVRVSRVVSSLLSSGAKY